MHSETKGQQKGKIVFQMYFIFLKWIDTYKKYI